MSCADVLGYTRCAIVCQHFGFQQRAEDLTGEQLVVSFVVEAFNVTVLPWGARLDVEAFYPTLFEPLLDGIGYELRAIIAADVFGHSIAFHGRFHYRDHIHRPDRPGHMDSQALPGVFIDQGQHPQFTAIFSLVLHKVPAPHMVGMLRFLPQAGALSHTTHLTLAFAYFETLLSAHPLASFPVGDQFRDATQMVFRLVASCLAGFYGLLDGSLEVFPAGIAEWFLEVAGKPEFHR